MVAISSYARSTFLLSVIGPAKTVAREKRYISDDSSRYVNAEV